MTRLIQQVPFFDATILVTTLIPVQYYLTFHEELIKEFFQNNHEAYWLLGKKSAEYALQLGPYKRHLMQHDIVKFLGTGLPLLWTQYFTVGELHGTLQEHVIHVKSLGVPVQHEYFDHGIMGFVHRACELVWQRDLTPQKIANTLPSPHAVHYMFTPTQAKSEQTP